jgi:glycosyltransferase involved in cell wall biosynthesis
MIADSASRLNLAAARRDRAAANPDAAMPPAAALRAFESPLADAPPRGPLRVALFSGNYNYVMDGPVRALNKLVDRLEELGHAVVVFAPTTRTPAFKHSGRLVSAPSVPLPGSRREYRFTLGLTPALKSDLDAFGPTLVHIAAPDLLGLGALNYARRRGVPAVASFHTRFDTYPRYYGARWAEKHVLSYMRWFYSRCAHVYPPSQSMAQELRAERLGRDLRIWARGVDADLFHPKRRDAGWRRKMGFAEGDVVIAFVGRLVLEKGIDDFADAVRIAQAADPKIKALVVGMGPERARFEQRLPGGVFTGFLEGEALARAYASADIFFNPSITETFGQVTLEALASGLPVTCANASGSVSLVEHGASGLHAAPGAGPGEFAALLTRLAGDGALRRRMSAAARAAAMNFDWQVILDGLIDNYHDAVATFKESGR